MISPELQNEIDEFIKEKVGEFHQKRIEVNLLCNDFIQKFKKMFRRVLTFFSFSYTIKAESYVK